MTAREFLKSKGIEYNHDTEMSVYVQNAGSTINAIISLMEEYHRAKLLESITDAKSVEPHCR